MIDNVIRNQVYISMILIKLESLAVTKNCLFQAFLMPSYLVVLDLEPQNFSTPLTCFFSNLVHHQIFAALNI